MLQKLYIKNYAIIDNLNIVFDPQLNVITGETGAGKSIILGALSLILGDRADTSVLINREEKCIVEASFHTKDNPAMKDLLLEEDLDYDEVTLIRREINTSGKSRAFINDTPVTLNVLNKITANLVDLHRQFDNYVLKDIAFMYEVVDAMSGNQQLIKTYQQHFKSYKSLKQKIEAALSSQQEWQKEADYKQFLFDELKTAAFEPEEIEEAEISIKKLSHSEQIKSALAFVSQLLESDETAVNSQLKRCLSQLESISEVFPEAESLAKRLDSTWIELKDIAFETDRLEQGIDLNEEQLSHLQERLDLGYRLLKKHQVQTTVDLIQLQSDLAKDLEQHSNSDEQINLLKSELEESQKQLKRLADDIHQNRTTNAPKLSSSVNELLHLIGMPNATLKVAVSKTDSFNDYGTDQLSFLWDANKSGNFQPLQKSASGGELSRIMLCIKTLTAKALAMPTLIFDEVDTGISGEAARQVGILLKKLGESHQVMSITHQPQIAAKGAAHFYVYKFEEDGKINTKIRQLKKDERIEILAQMIGGDQPTPAALKNARELMEK